MTEMYNQFSNEYNELFAQNCIEFLKKHKNEKLQDEYFHTFYPSFGTKKNEPCDFLIIGQAVNGWGSGFNTDIEINPESLINDAIKSSNNYCVAHNHSPIDWVNVAWSKSLFAEHMKDTSKEEFYRKRTNDGKYQVYRSFFWQVTYKLISDYYGFDRQEKGLWSKKIVWSNLYKIAPEDKNPDGSQQNKQLDLSIKLIKKEIEELKPKFCIVLTNGAWWIPFQKNIETENLEFNSNLTEIVFHEKYLGTQIIVTKRPRFGNSDKYVKQILELIK